ncbi:hypothetical protein D5085_06800 [Ectothiorhodospiraceae bacterium BW-2]|nr:hypothetical protein D5085_06800 [Ectothiorhodospiraceae bacterium BW-2]
MTLSLKALLLLSIPTLLISCGGSEEESPPPNNLVDGGTQTATTLTQLWDSYNLADCAFCHGPQGTELNGPDLSDKDKFYNSLVDKTALNDYPTWLITANCSATLPFIRPNSTTESTLLAALSENDSTLMTETIGCATAYNLHSQNNVSQANNPQFISDLTQWINSGAQNN